VASQILPTSNQALLAWRNYRLGLLLWLVFGLFLVFLLYEWLFDPNALYGIGLKNTASVTFMGVMYLLAVVIYVVARMVRKGQGIDLDKVYKEIPVE